MIRLPKNIIITFCEGKAEKNLLLYLRSKYSNGKNRFNPELLDGFSNYEMFRNKYEDKMTKLSLEPKKEYSSIRKLFLIDDDLEESEKIIEFLTREEHIIQTCYPNIEGMILSATGKKLGTNTKNESFRKKCKDMFKREFGCEADEIKENKLDRILSIEDIKNHLPILFALLSEE
jgi:hypothetical protein